MPGFLGRNNKTKEKKNDIDNTSKQIPNINQSKAFSISNSPLLKPVELLSDSVHYFSLSRNKKKRRGSLKSTNTESISEVISNKSKTQSNSHISEYDTLPSMNSTSNDNTRINSKNDSSSPFLISNMKNLKIDPSSSPASVSPVTPSSPVNNTLSSFNGINNSIEVDINEQTISYNYRQSISNYLENCKQNVFERSDFNSSDGIYKWEEGAENRSIEYILSLLLNYRFSLEWENEKRKIQKAKETKKSLINDGTSIKINFKIMEAKDLVCKEKVLRSTFCELIYDNVIYQTQVVPNTNTPLFNQHISIEITDISKNVVINVYDANRVQKHFGKVIMSNNQEVVILHF